MSADCGPISPYSYLLVIFFYVLVKLPENPYYIFCTQYYKSKTISGTGFLNILPISEITLTASISTGQYRSNESEVES